VPAYVEGFVETKRALRKFAPDLYKEMNREIRHAMAGIINDAKKKLPSEFPYELRNFNDKGKDVQSRTSKARPFPVYNHSVVRKGLVYSFTGQRPSTGGFKALYSLMNKSAAGAIIETAGSKNPAGQPHISQRRYGQSSKNMSMSQNPDAGKHFINMMTYEVGSLKSAGANSKYRGRLLIAAYAENQGRAVSQIMKAINKASTDFNNRVKSGAIAA
jgi:hypothetical protein